MGQMAKSSLIKFPSTPITAGELFSFWLAISEPPSRYFCQIMALLLKQLFKMREPTQEQRLKSQKLLHFSSKTADGKSEYFSYCVKEKRTLVEVFKDFGISGEIMPLEFLIQHAGRQKPREFSISSAVRKDDKDQTEVDLTIAITEYETKFKRKIEGVCTGWLRKAPVGEQVPVWLKHGSMHIFTDRPLIMVGPGTGVAPFRSFIQGLKD